jgi:hypothetical protein
MCGQFVFEIGPVSWVPIEVRGEIENRQGSDLLELRAAQTNAQPTVSAKARRVWFQGGDASP